jgi:hypothetical protein
MNSTVFENKYLSLDEIGLPSGVQLYIPTGIEGNYKSIIQPEDQTTHDDWLYLPNEKIEYWKDALNKNTEFTKVSPLQFEDNWIFPLIENNKIICLLVNSIKSLSGVSSDQLNAVLEKYNINNKIIDTEDELTTELLTALYSYDSDIESFTKRFLKLIVEECDQCCAGLYYFDGVSYNLRFALGDLDRIDLLRRQPSDEIVKTWGKYIDNKKYFIPAELLPTDISYLNNPPEYYFVHPGIKSRTRKYLICLALDGDTSERFAKKIHRLASFYSKLDEKQFIKSCSVLNLYEELLDTPGETREIEQILTRIYKLLSIQADINKIQWVDHKKCSWSITYDNEKQAVKVTTENLDSVEQFEKLLTGKNEQLIEGTDPSEVNSDLWYRLRLPGRNDGYLLFTAQAGSELLKNYRSLFKDVKLFLLNYYWLGWYPEKTSDFLGVEPSNVNSGSTLQRFDTIGKLVDGYYHHIYSLMSVIIGQSDILNNLLDSADSEKVANGIKKINFAADEVTDKLKKLQTIYPSLSSEFAREISCKSFLKQLPTYIQGFLTRIKDIMGIGLRIQVDISSKNDFMLKMFDVFDTILPLIVGIIEQSISSGIISFKLENDLNRKSLIISFSKNIIEHTDISKLMQQVFVYHDFIDDGFGGGEVRINEIKLKVNNNDDDTYIIKIEPIMNQNSYSVLTRKSSSLIY